MDNFLGVFFGTMLFIVAAVPWPVTDVDIESINKLAARCETGVDKIKVSGGYGHTRHETNQVHCKDGTVLESELTNE